MRRRDLAPALFASAAGSVSFSQPRATPGSGEPCYPRTSEEAATGVIPKNCAYPAGNVLRYGADPSNTHDSAEAFNSACRSGAGMVIVPPGTYQIASTITVDISKTSLVGQNAVLASTLARGSLLLITSSAGAEANAKNCIAGIEFGGRNVPGVYAVEIHGKAPSVAGFTIARCSFTSFDKFVLIYSHAYMLSFYGCTFSQGGASGGIHVPAGGADYGERISFTDCNFFNNKICLQADYPPAQFYLSGCSLDYSHQVAVMNAGYAVFSNCFFENNIDTGYWFTAGEAGTTILVNHCTIAQTGPKPNYEIACSNSRTGTLNFRNCQLYSGTNVVRAALVAGAGNAFGSGNNVDGFANNAYAWSIFSAASQLCSNGTFERGLSGWTCGSRSGAGGDPHVAGNTLALQVAADGHDQFAYWTVNAAPGENVGFVCHAAANNPATGFGMTIRCVGGDGGVILSSPGIAGLSAFGRSSPLSVDRYSECRATMLRLPAGTASVQFELHTAGPTSPEYRVAVRDVLIGRY
jgi:hypothetical protein